MSASNRASVYNKIYRVLKKHYKPVPSPKGWMVLENMLYGCCLENSHYNKAQAAFERLRDSFFDWNEIRVTTVKELAEVLRDLPDPVLSASNLKRALQCVFEANYSFDLEAMHKMNIGKAVKVLGKHHVPSYVVSYVVQNSLGGHSIPLDAGAIQALTIVGVISESEAKSCSAPGLERTIPKSKGVEFGSLLHQLSADLVGTPHSPSVRTILLEIDPSAQDRLPRRKSTKKAAKRASGKSSSKSPAAKKVVGKPKKKVKATKKKPAKVAKKSKSTSAATTKAKSTSKTQKKKSSPKKKKSTSSRIAKRKPR